MADGSKWHLVQDLFDQVLECAPEQRAALLDEACGDNKELRAEVESLLELEERVPDGFLRPPALLADVPGAMSTAFRVDMPDDGPDPLIGQHVGGCEITRVIAVGGMGAVYAAEQDQPRRTVAIKVMRRWTASRSTLRRFQFESEILATLRHPNVAQVYQAGMQTDREGVLGPKDARIPYFVMEYIPEAETLTRYAREKKLSTRERLRLFAKVCDAVHHGHQKGIIHRDLKPGNILVDTAGEPKVIDFGVARATDSDIAVTTALTDVGQLIGTLQYMSPEQCAADPGEIDTRCDVYALGVVLHELLTGELPYEIEGSSIVKVARVICEHTPIRPSAIDRKLRGDVEMIVLKALEKEREKRYQSAGDLAQDVRRHLNREPIEARPPTAWTHAVRWSMRHPIFATTIACLAVAALVAAGTYFSLWYFNSRPYDVKCFNNNHEARLLAYDTNVLHTWSGNITFAKLVDRPDEFGGGKLALIGFGGLQDRPRQGSLCAFNAEGDRDQPVWQDRVTAEDILPELRDRGYTEAEFGAADCWVFDIFTGLPGDEVVVVFVAGEHSQRVLRIYNLSGKRLYQVWHDGSLGCCQWMKDARLLVLAGNCHEPYWIGDQPCGKRAYDFVVLALQPKPGFRCEDDYLPCKAGSDPLSPKWYYRLGPDSALADVKRVRLGESGPRYNPGSAVRVSVDVPEKPGFNVWWVVDQDGKEIPGSRDCGDNYKLNRRLPESDPGKLNLPDPGVFQLDPYDEAEDAAAN